MNDQLVDSRDTKSVSDLMRPSLREVVEFGSNPGNLRMHVFVPLGRSRPRPLVIVLHGCRQTARGYDAASGWSRLAQAEDFLLLYAEQKHTNNSDACFSWFEQERRNREVTSIRQMIDKVATTTSVDPRRIYACGLSAGGTMSGALLATFPQLFAGGAIIAGLPFGSAANLSEAYASMLGQARPSKAWGDLVRAASRQTNSGHATSGQAGPWPPVSIWYGTADKVVNPINAGELVKQWTDVHGIAAAVPNEDRVGAITRRLWYDRAKRACIREYSVPGLGHGTPVDDKVPPAPFFLPAGVSSTLQIAHDWGLTRAAVRRPAPAEAQTTSPHARSPTMLDRVKEWVGLSASSRSPRPPHP